MTIFSTSTTVPTYPQGTCPPISIPLSHTPVHVTHQLTNTQVQDPLASLPTSLRNHQMEGSVYSATASNAATASPATLEWCLGLCRTNMQALYQQASWGWKDDEKRAEISSVSQARMSTT